jgi:hypothetical protein
MWLAAATILLKSGRAQAEQSVSLKGLLPTQQLILRQLVAAVGLLTGQHAICRGGHDRRLASERPSFDVGRWQHRLIHKTGLSPI